MVGGKTYYFRIRSKNIWGWSDFSTSLPVKASAAPDQMDTVITSINLSDGGVKISWTAPNTNQEPITSYLIEIAHKSDSNWD